ncbi:hypothetical protein BDV28DRAFT_135134 [Aspergillus coremiiformis]|uniref:Phosphoglycerate mutase family protein n=1 Tax=Aspergillus coremiiformis TaxID=138285 RepID=A0A5N6Z484_9EURO|nr:hypothetical protein BDV28DRAFT_135134 [Aspergillus coremiiformis]
MATTILSLFLHLFLFSALHSVTYASDPPTVYLIRHGEKSGNPLDSGLNADGFKRAACIQGIFGADSHYKIGYIMAPHVNKKGQHRRSYETVLPLATDLGLTIDTSCKRNHVHCVADKIADYDGPGNILIAWRHGKMKKLVRALGYDDPPRYPDNRFDLVWTIPFPYNNITDIRSEECPGLDVPETLSIEL